MKKSQFLELLNLLAAELNHFKLNYLKTQNGCETQLNLVTEILKRINQLEELEILVLSDQDYTHFCMLLVYGGLMAESLKNMKRLSRRKMQHARNWHELQKTFKPLLEENVRTPTQQATE